jgi:peptidoglycan/LPS O-acetylase OafA/YrhL
MPDPQLISIVCVVLTIVFAMGLNRWIARPIEKLRHALRGRPAAASLLQLLRGARRAQTAAANAPACPTPLN